MYGFNITVHAGVIPVPDDVNAGGFDGMPVKGPKGAASAIAGRIRHRKITA